MDNLSGEQLQRLMAEKGLTSESQLAAATGVAERQIYRLGQGLICALPIADLVKLAQYFELSVDDFLGAFLPIAVQPMDFDANVGRSPAPSTPEPELPTDEIEQQIEALESPEITALKAEYNRLEQTFEQQKNTLQQQWQQAALEQLESWLLQWSAAAKAAQENPDFPAKTLVALAKPFDQLLESWHVTPIGSVGETVEYDPQIHQLVKGGFDTQTGDPVTIQNVGYMQGDRLLHRAKVMS
ncbi:nucleotide exchange factor GrpE [[Limnothrix rosea] IAM M-220]|nr:nucleotide exchange factor GrpE [[Limnothrix rosea] IAM M-220]